MGMDEQREKLSYKVNIVTIRTSGPSWTDLPLEDPRWPRGLDALLHDRNGCERTERRRKRGREEVKTGD